MLLAKMLLAVVVVFCVEQSRVKYS